MAKGKPEDYECRIAYLRELVKFAYEKEMVITKDNLFNALRGNKQYYFERIHKELPGTDLSSLDSQIKGKLSGFQYFHDLRSVLASNKSYSIDKLAIIAAYLDYPDGYNEFKNKRLFYNCTINESKSELFKTLQLDSPRCDFPVELSSAENNFFVGRESKLKELVECQSKVIVIQGLRGIGKTTFVHKFVNQHINEFSHICYASVSNGNVAEAVLSAFEKSDQITFKRLTNDDGEVDIVSSMNVLGGVLKSLNYSSPLLIIDNANLNSPLESFLNRWIRFSLNWKLIITTCTDIDINGKIEKIQLQGLTKDDAVKIFNNYCQRMKANEKIINILKSFDFHPLLTELLAKIIENNKRLSPETIKNLFSIKSKAIKEPQTIIPEIANEFYIETEITLVELISALVKDMSNGLKESQVKLLQYLSIIPSKGYSAEKLKDIIPVVDEDFETLDKLQKWGWLIGGDNSFKMHELMQLAVIQRFKPDANSCSELIIKIEKGMKLSELEAMEKTVLDVCHLLEPAKQIISNLYFFENEFLNPNDPRLLLTINKMLDNREFIGKDQKNDNIDLCELIRRTALACNGMSQKKEAYLYSLESLKMSCRLYKENNLPVGKSLFTFANNLATCGRGDVALSLRERTKEIIAKDSNTTDRYKSTVNRYVAISYRKHGRFEDAIQCYSDNIEYIDKQLNTNTDYEFDKAQNYCDLAFVFSDMGKAAKNDKSISREVYESFFKNAIDYRKKALEIRERKYSDKNHLKIATIHNDLGAMYSRLEDYEQALKHYTICWEIRKEKLVPHHEHLSNAVIKNNVADCLVKLNKVLEIDIKEKEVNVEKALENCEFSIELKSKKYHPDDYHLGPNYRTKGRILFEKYLLYKNDRKVLYEAKMFVEKSIEAFKKNIPVVEHDIANSIELLNEINAEL